MANYTEVAYITKVLECADLSVIQSMKIGRAHFTDLEMREVYSLILSHMEQHGEVPSLGLLQDMVNFEPEDGDDSLEALAARLREKYLYNDITLLVNKVQFQLSQDSEHALTVLQQGAHDLALRHVEVEDLNATHQMDDVMARYLAKQDARNGGNGGLTGLPWLWEYVNGVTGGIKSSDFVLFTGQAKSYKSWFLINMLLNIHRTTGKRPVMATREMKPQEVIDRVVCQYANLPWAAFNNGRLDEAQFKDFKLATERFQDEPPFHIVEIKSNGIDGLMEYRNKLKQLEAEVGGFDGFYFLSPKSDWKELTELTRACRRMGLEMDVPQIINTQSNKEGEAAYSRSFQQDITYMARIACGPESRQQREAVIDWPFVRDHVLDPIVVHTRPGETFGQKRVFLADGEGGEDSILPDDEGDNDLDTRTEVGG